VALAIAMGGEVMHMMLDGNYTKNFFPINMKKKHRKEMF
jgi:hypothetical protein